MKSQNFLKVFRFLQLRLWPWPVKEVISELCWQTSQPVSCFQLIVRYEFPKDSVHYEGSDLIFIQVISRVTQRRIEFPVADLTLNTALYLKQKIMRFDATGIVLIVLMQHTWQKMHKTMKTLQVWNPPPCSHITWGVCVWWQMENSVAEQCFLETFDRKGSGYNLYCCKVTIKVID